MRERCLTMLLPVGHYVTKETRRGLYPSQTAEWPTWACGFVPQEAATVIAGNIVARHGAIALIGM